MNTTAASAGTCMAIAVLLLNVVCLADELPVNLQVSRIATLPLPVSNNAVTTVTVDERQFVISFLGLGAGKTHNDTLSETFVLDEKSGQWSVAAPVPGGVGRLAAAATSVGGLAYIFGGYTVAENGSEVSTPWTHAFDPLTGQFSERQAMPVPIDDAIAVAYDDRYIYLISGWHDLGNVNLVQRFDTEMNAWVQATPIPGHAVFGHAGGIVGNRIVYCDGVTIRPNADKARDFVASTECFMGIIDAKDGRRIDWRSIDSHPGAARYRMASVGIAARKAVLFIGGSENPYNYDGIGYDGEPSEPVGSALLFDLESLQWQRLSTDSTATMDHRGLVHYKDGWLTIGGMQSEQTVTDQVILYVFR